MTAIFFRIVNMSITAGWIVLVVMVLRLLLRKMPKQLTCMLWALVGIRLVFPVSMESIFSLIPSSETIPETIVHGTLPEINSGISTIDRVVNPAAKASFTYLSTGLCAADPRISSGAEALEFILRSAALLWLAGMCLMFSYMIFSYLRLSRKLRTAVSFHPCEQRTTVTACRHSATAARVRYPAACGGVSDPGISGNEDAAKGALYARIEDTIRQSEFVDSPFILGLIKPRIYIPFHLSEDALPHVLAHEYAHLARKDHLVKAFAFCLLCVYWFHPLLWAAYILLCRDIELACDERVLQNYSKTAKKGYLLSLIGYDKKKTAGKIPAPACPLSFGEVGVKERIVRAKTWKKPAFALVLPALLLCAVAAFCLLTDPKEKLSFAPEPFGHPYQVESIVYQAPWYDFWLIPEAAPLYILTADYQLMESTDVPAASDSGHGFWRSCGEAEEIRLTEKMLKDYIPEVPDAPDHADSILSDDMFIKDTSIEKLVKENKKTWAVHSQDSELSLFYYIMQQKNGDVYLSYGYDTERLPHIRFLFKLSALQAESLSADTLYKWRTKYIGDNSAVGNIIYNLTFPEDMTYKQFALQTDDSEPYSVTITFTMSDEDKEAYDLDHPTRQEEVALLQQNACVMFALIENAEIVNFKLVDKTDEEKRPLTLVYLREWAEKETNCNLWEESETKEQFEVLLIKLEEKFSHTYP